MSFPPAPENNNPGGAHAAEPNDFPPAPETAFAAPSEPVQQPFSNVPPAQNPATGQFVQPLTAQPTQEAQPAPPAQPAQPALPSRNPDNRRPPSNRISLRPSLANRLLTPTPLPAPGFSLLLAILRKSPAVSPARAASTLPPRSRTANL